MSITATYKSVDELRKAIVSPLPQAYIDKMLHKIPELPVVKDRAAYLVEKAKGKVVLDIGCTGPISQAIKASASKYYGIDKQPGATEVVELDTDELPYWEDVEVVIASEVLEHLSNPGNFLAGLKKYEGRTIYITVPNAGAYSVKDGCEVVNPDHVCWYSYNTLKVLLTRYGYEIKAARWYNGAPYKAEGLIMEVT